MAHDLDVSSSPVPVDQPVPSEDPDRLLLFARQVLSWAAAHTDWMTSPHVLGKWDPNGMTVFSRFWIAPEEALLPDAELAKLMAERIRDALRLLKELIDRDHMGSIQSPVSVRPFVKSQKNGAWYSELTCQTGMGGPIHFRRRTR